MITIEQLYDIYTKHNCITTDSRTCPEGSIFLALKGDNFDGNRFAIDALRKGCAYAIVDDKNVTDGLTDDIAPERIIVVDNTLATFKALARHHRRQFDIPVVGITGTNGKTTTKELTAAVLRKKYNVLATEGNFNNDVGVPKTLFRLNDSHDIAVIEMGASHPGDIKTLAETAEPTCGIITNVGKAHLQGFGSLKGVLQTKGELYDYLSKRDESVIFINADNDLLVSILPDKAWVSPYTTNKDNAEGCVCGEITDCSPFLTMRWRESGMDLEDRQAEPQWYEVETKLIGSYNIDNVLAAVTIGLQFAVEPELICEAIAEYTPTNNRSQLLKTAHNSLIVDAYNANPTSMEAALLNFGQVKASPKMAIVGEMRELGDASREEHGHIVKVLKQCRFDKVWLVGNEYAGIKCHYRKFADAEEVKAALREEPIEGYTILIKGSNGTHLYELPEYL